MYTVLRKLHRKVVMHTIAKILYHMLFFFDSDVEIVFKFLLLEIDFSNI